MNEILFGIGLGLCSGATIAGFWFSGHRTSEAARARIVACVASSAGCAVLLALLIVELQEATA